MVDELGPGVDGIAVGDVVAAMTVFGAYADAVGLPTAHLAPVPAGVDPAVAVCLAFNYVTALQMLTRTVRARPGARLLVHGAAGGIGTAALEIGRIP
jgi:NADPH2:quinone reductase